MEREVPWFDENNTTRAGVDLDDDNATEASGSSIFFSLWLLFLLGLFFLRESNMQKRIFSDCTLLLCFLFLPEILFFF